VCRLLFYLDSIEHMCFAIEGEYANRKSAGSAENNGESLNTGGSGSADHGIPGRMGGFPGSIATAAAGDSFRIGIADMRLVQEGGQRRLLVAACGCGGDLTCLRYWNSCRRRPTDGGVGCGGRGTAVAAALCLRQCAPFVVGRIHPARGNRRFCARSCFPWRLGSRQSQCQFLVIDPQIGRGGQRRELAPVAHLPHMLAPPARDRQRFPPLFSFLLRSWPFVRRPVIRRRRFSPCN
jgi:hypothetical protein